MRFMVQVSGLGCEWDLGYYDSYEEAVIAIDMDKDYQFETGNKSAHNYWYEILPVFSKEEVQIKCESMGLDLYDEELYIALQALHLEYNGNGIAIAALNDGVV